MKKYYVKNIKCGGCAANITKTLSEEFKDVEVNVEEGSISLDLNGKNEEVLVEKLHGMGYPMSDEKLGFFQNKTMEVKSFVSCAIGKTMVEK
ncbi:MAG: heavy-metal-associated domain-containing protein [Campylobacterales bacterium]|nr:heavy-metal-associated domain-containing protein [Campylobacterales bacterium]